MSIHPRWQALFYTERKKKKRRVALFHGAPQNQAQAGTPIGT
jgi:hypothetical protein